MAGITRFGVSIDNQLIRKFDALISRKGYATRFAQQRLPVRRSNSLLKTTIIFTRSLSIITAGSAIRTWREPVALTC